MSGTSADGIDAVLVDFDKKKEVRIIATHSKAYPNLTFEKVVSLYTPRTNEIDILGQLDREIGILFSDSVFELLKLAQVDKCKITAIGSHGQTIRHRPNFEHPFTFQIGDPNTIAEKTGILTVADFRRRDIAADGQGAPLTPSFHEKFFFLQAKKTLRN